MQLTINNFGNGCKNRSYLPMITVAATAVTWENVWWWLSMITMNSYERAATITDEEWLIFCDRGPQHSYCHWSELQQPQLQQLWWIRIMFNPANKYYYNSYGYNGHCFNDGKRYDDGFCCNKRHSWWRLSLLWWYKNEKFTEVHSWYNVLAYTTEDAQVSSMSSIVDLFDTRKLFGRKLLHLSSELVS